MEKSYRIHTSTPSDITLNVNMKQDFDFLEVLSLKLSQEDAYKLHSSNYGVIVGRVLANDAFGVPNAKISVFIERDTNDVSELEKIYPYTEVTSKDKDNRRYNLLPDYSDDDCYRIVGTFPNKRLLLDDVTYIEVYEKYWKYTTVTNQAGDYMIFGVPTGSHQIHTDIDLSDIGILSQKPRDFIYKGYNMTEFDNANQFKESTNLDVLKQIISQDKSTFVYPFWGDADNGIAAITRCDVQVDYKFEPTCIFLGSIVSDNEGNAIGHKCSPSVDNGMNSQLVAGEGTIEMIRKTLDGLVEEYPIQGNRLIDSDGVWCYQIPMNLDYVGTDEYGNIVPTDNPNKGIPTRTQVRFRISKVETGDEGFSRHTAKYLVPINPNLKEDKEKPTLGVSKAELERMYEFGSSTPQSCFRDLYWNNVYSVKNYIPKIQTASKSYSTHYSALKGGNLVENQNPIPFNKLRIDIPFMYMIVCILFSIIVVIISIINQGIICTIDSVLKIFWKIKRIKIWKWRPFGWLPVPGYIACISLGAGLSEDNKAYYPGCGCSEGREAASCPEGMENNCVKVNDNTELKDKIQQNLAQEYKIVKLDLYQDWINGCLYMPLWYWRKRKKKTFLFGLFSKSAKNEFCDCDKTYSRLKTAVTCNIVYGGKDFEVDNDRLTDKESRWHKNRRDSIRFRNGVIKGVTNKDDLTVYYYTAMQPTASYSDSKPTVIRLYATDIILLGNINENNLYGIPQFFKSLPSTTANIPPIATIQESTEDTEGKDSQSDIGNGEDSGTTVTTGMDWGAHGDDETPTYSTGLFLDLACTYAATKAKSCINVERLSELGVNLDMTYNMSYANGGNYIKTGVINSDGFISKSELDDLDNRSAFATLNHIGFVPQSYQNSISGYTTQVEDDNTNYLVPKFKYIFPVDFDGRMQPIMNNYKKTFEQAMFDEIDEAYISFRLGAEENGGHGRKRHFYNISNGDYSMPLYNNSFYFYFGINKGNTAIDKFNSMFMAECFQNKKEAFSLYVDYKGRSYCPSIYETGGTSTYHGYGYITVSSDDIVAPYTYTLYDSVGNIVVRESDMVASPFTIGDGDNGAVLYQIPVDDDDDPSTEKVRMPVEGIYGIEGLSNQIYNLVLVDDNGKSVSKRINLSVPNMSLNYTTVKLGTKFYNTASTKKTYICSPETDLYGKVIIDEFFIDGISCKIKNDTSATVIYNPSDNEYVVTGLRLTDNNNSENILDDEKLKVTVKLKSLENDTKDCLCDVNSSTISIVGENDDACAGVILKKVRVDDVLETTLQFDMYQPNKYLITLELDGSECDTQENSYSELVRVYNGEIFNTYLNDMPIKFMLGTTNDNTGMTVSKSSKFYNVDAVRTPTDSHICGWYGVHQEDSYQFGRSELQTLEQNRNTWEDFVEITDTMSNPITRLNIIKYKFEKMFSLSDAVYNSYEFRYTSTGGITPILFRTVAPQYSNTNAMLNNYEFADSSMITVPQEYPNIVGSNYSGHTRENKVSFNKLYDKSEYIGNYFAAFSNNGGYKNKKTLDKKLAVARIPNYSDISPYNGLKELGKIITGNIDNTFRNVHTQGNHVIPGSTQNAVKPYLRALAVDRRISYNLTILAPVVGSTFSLYQNADDNRNKYWRNTRISGNIYGGVEMSYDDNYNIISANTVYDDDGNIVSVSSANTLEYSYIIPSGNADAKTIYVPNPTVKKKFYEFSLGGADIREYLWSDFSGDIGTKSSGDTPATAITPYIFSYPRTQTDYYNGDFTRENAIKNNGYPTKRYIDVCGIPSFGTYNLTLTSCGYPSRVILDSTNNTLSCEATQGESIDIDFTFDRTIQFVTTTDDSSTEANVIYKYYGSGGNGYMKFISDKALLAFTVTNNAVDNYDVYSPFPAVIKVLPYINGVDGITYFKTANPTGENSWARKSFRDALDNIRIYQFAGEKRRSINIFSTDIVRGDTIFPEAYDDRGRLENHFTDKYGNEIFLGADFLMIDDEYVVCNDSDYSKIIFAKNIDLSDSKVITIVVTRLYVSSNDDKLNNMITTYEFGDLYDCRDILLAPDPSNSYVTLEQYQSSGEETQENTESTTNVYYQTLAFKTTVPLTGDPKTMTCQEFADYDSMSFSFAFKKGDNQYVLDASDVIWTNKPSDPSTQVDHLELSFKVKWTQEMGYLGQNRDSWTVYMIVKTYSGFSYKIPFKIVISGNQSLPTDVGSSVQTNFKMSKE